MTIKQAWKLIECGEQLATKYKLPSHLSFAYMTLGLYYRRVEDETSSLHFLAKALRTAEDNEALEYLSGILLNLSAVQLQMQFIEEGSQA